MSKGHPILIGEVLVRLSFLTPLHLRPFSTEAERAAGGRTVTALRTASGAKTCREPARARAGSPRLVPQNKVCSRWRFIQGGRGQEFLRQHAQSSAGCCRFACCQRIRAACWTVLDLTHDCRWTRPVEIFFRCTVM